MSEKPVETLFIPNEGPYGNERSYNALRLDGVPGLAQAKGSDGATARCLALS